MIIYIRHSDDEGGDCPKLQDCNLSSKGKRLAKTVGERIIQKYGLPHIIYCSPFHRTLQTMNYMLTNQPRDNIRIIKENRVSRYFSQREKQRPSVEKTTMMSKIPIHEDYKEFKSRIADFSKFVTSEASHLGKIVWVITHTLAYKQFARIHDIGIPDHIPFMHYFVLREHSKQAEPVCEHCGKVHHH